MAELPEELQYELTRLEKEFWVSTSRLNTIVKRFIEELDEGLSEQGGNIPMCVSWVFGYPSGNETGTFLSLDLGGTNMRVCKVDLHGNNPQNGERHTLIQEKYKLSEDIKTGTADQLWNYIAENLETFMRNQGLDKHYSQEKPMPLAFAFSYPATQHSIDHGILQRWTKGFDISGVENHDVAAQLRDAMSARKLPIELICVVNDTVGAMIASAYDDPKTIIGGIFGTGCNAAYMQHLTRSPPAIPKLQLRDDEWSILEKEGENGMRMAINCEYGAFDNAHKVLPCTKYDKIVDKQSPRPGQQTFEKLSAGHYLGEIFRLILVELFEKGLVFKGMKSDSGASRTLHKAYSLDAALLTHIEDDFSPGFEDTKALLTKALGVEPKDHEIQLCRHLAKMIAVRGARLCACGTAAIAGKEGLKSGHVAADGSVALKNPRFKSTWSKALGEILGWKGQDDGPIKLVRAEDGSGVGVAIVAAMTLERRQRGNKVGIRIEKVSSR